MKNGTIVLSKAGRDAGRLFCVVDDREENFRFIADGRLRKADRSKRKKCKHLEKLGHSPVLEALIKSNGLTNKLLRQELALFEKSEAE